MVALAQVEEWQGSAEELIGRIVKTPCCCALLKIWQDARTEPHCPPKKSDLDPVLLARSGLMPDLWLIERVDDDYFFRLTGEDVRSLFTTPIKGLFVHEVFQEPALSSMRRRYDRILLDHRVEYSSGQVYDGDAPNYYGHRLMLPLDDDLGATRYLIGTVDRSDCRPRTQTKCNPHYTYDFIGSAPVAEI